MEFIFSCHHIRMLLFLATYPDEKSQYEGMSQRVVAIDKSLKDYERIYLFVSYRMFFRKQIIQIDSKAVQYKANLFVHFFFIFRLFRKATSLYFHSVINVLPVLPFMYFLRKDQFVVMDAHGLVPEEQIISGTRWKSKLYEWSERKLFKEADLIISVNKTMERHFQRKYPFSKTDYMVMPILPGHLKDDNYTPDGSTHATEEIRVVYSGNTQAWQNIDDMIAVIKRNNSVRVRYNILTGEVALMKQYLMDAGLGESPNIHVLTVAPDELRHYYRDAHYGFMMRGDIQVSRSSCPTKMIEYMYYGMVPIMKTLYIGDFHEMGCDAVLGVDFSLELGARKSIKNHEIIAHLLSEEEQKMSNLKAMMVHGTVA